MPDSNILIHDFDYKPKPVFYSLPKEETDLYFGIEIEVEDTEDHGHNNTVRKLRDGSELFRELFYCKNDGSLNNGFEIVSHPMTYKYLKKHSNDIFKFLEVLHYSGFKSFNTTTCGIHIHLSKKAFTGLHLYKFLKFFYDTDLFFIHNIGQRLPNRYCFPHNHGKHIAKIVKDKTSPNRYTMVNIQNANSVEVRIFKGNLRYTSVIKNLEFCDAVYNFTKISSLHSFNEGSGRDTIKSFLNYITAKNIMDGNIGYINLIDFIYCNDINSVYQY